MLQSITEYQILKKLRKYLHKTPAIIGGLEIVEMRVSMRGKYVYSHKFKCYCGNTFVSEAANVKSGHTKSCGCLQKAIVSNREYVHGKHESSTYASWENMIQRCTNPNATGYEYYGGRGISVCKEWRTFVNFLADMGDRPENTSIDRINSDGNYEPNNCRWADKTTQMKNRRPRSCYKKTK